MMRFSSSGFSVRHAWTLMKPACWLLRIHQVNGLTAWETSLDSGNRKDSSGIAGPLSPAATLPARGSPPHRSAIPLPLDGRPVGAHPAGLLQWQDVQAPSRLGARHMSLYQVQQCLFDY